MYGVPLQFFLKPEGERKKKKKKLGGKRINE
jgi:hypothetical protein